MKKSIISFLLFSFYITSSVFAEVKLPAIFSDDMVIQRDQPIKIWGWADPKEQVEISFGSQLLKTKTDKNGKWFAILKPMAFGGPYQLIVTGKTNKLEVGNILVGDVWIASGQSNMEWLVANVNNAKVEIDNANFPKIRSINVEQEMSFRPKDDFHGKWQVCSPANVGRFSAVGYFFARKIYMETGIPIGIVNSSWGGSDIETWISPEAFEPLSDKCKSKYKNNNQLINSEEFFKLNDEKRKVFEDAIRNDLGLKDEWYKTSMNISDLKTIPVPGNWSNNELENIDGVVWMYYDLTLPESVAGKEGEIELARIDDNDDTWINGVKVGSNSGWDINRVYKIASGILKPGVNRISVRIVDSSGDGGIYGNADEVVLKTDNQEFALAGDWKYKIAETNLKYNYIILSPNSYPSLIFNSMIYPMIQFPVKGVIWYQGEANAINAFNYRILFPTLIEDWRAKWGKEIPFYWVQLANYMPAESNPTESAWAELREAQTMTLRLPNTGMAVITDIGDADDVHPRNKQDVGLRLALNALKNDYGKNEIVCSGPQFKSMKIEKNKFIISFDNIGSGLDVHNNYGYLTGFTVAGPDHKFEWAKAYIDGDRVVVVSDKVSNPVAVRYNWANNPDGNLFNKENLPAGPFRTDNWKGVTEE